MTRTPLISALVAGLALASASPVLAQDGASGPPSSAGPMTVERVQSGFMVMPEVKATKLDGTTGTLAGATGGWLVDDAFLIGASGYGLTNGKSGRRLGYGGLTLGWFAGTEDPVSFGVRSLFGYGTAKLPETVFIATPVPGSRRDVVTPATRLFSRDFFVFEPQADFLVKFSRHARLDFTVGYRFVNGERGFQDDRLRGVTAGVGLQLTSGGH